MVTAYAAACEAEGFETLVLEDFLEVGNLAYVGMKMLDDSTALEIDLYGMEIADGEGLALLDFYYIAE